MNTFINHFITFPIVVSLIPNGMVFFSTFKASLPVRESDAYEEYLKSAELAKSEIIQQRLATFRKTNTLPKTYLDAAQSLSESGNKCLLLIKSGNERPFSLTPILTVADNFPEIEAFNEIGEIFYASAYYYASLGKYSVSCEFVNDALTFSYRIRKISYRHHLIGFRIAERMYKFLNFIIHKLSLEDIQAIYNNLYTLSKNENPLIKAVERETMMYIEAAEYVIFMDWSNWIDAKDENQEKLLTSIKDLSHAEKLNLKSKVVEIITKKSRELLYILTNYNPSKWEIIYTYPVNLSGVIAENLWLIPESNIRYESIIIAKNKLTLLSLKIYEYRWINGEYPLDLSDERFRDLLTDPLNEEHFSYLLSRNNFELYSRGNDKTGIIFLDKE